jgi:hypothetical protein
MYQSSFCGHQLTWVSFCHGVQVRCIQATLGDLISGSTLTGGAEDAAEPEDAVHTEVEVATVDSFQVVMH